MHYKSRLRMSLVLLIIVLLVLSCSTPLPTVISTSLPNHTQEVNSTPSIPFLTDPVEFTPTETPTVTAIPVPLLYAKVVSAGFMQTCAVTLSNGLKCWGNYVTNHPGDSSNNYHTYPEDIPGLENGVDDISSYGDFSCVLLTSGGVKCWGSNTYGSLGDDRASGDYSWDPVDVVGLSSGVNVITTGMYHVCALLQNGSVKCWGANAGGLLGNGTNYISTVPSDVIGLSSGVKDIAAGNNHTCALMVTGGVKCWGANGYGPILGSGFADTHYPVYAVVDVKGLSSGIVAITAGNDFTCVLLESGGVKCWGYNSGGYLGDGTEIDRPTPVDVINLNLPVVSLSAGDNSSCVLLNDGTIKCWGRNLLRQQGDELYLSSPTSIEVFSKIITAVSIGRTHTCAIMEDSAIMCWGLNDFGQLGVGTTDRLLPPTYVLCPDCQP
jgi:alpha-tubulin suppressor-like RCC1 family protein